MIGIGEIKLISQGNRLYRSRLDVANELFDRSIYDLYEKECIFIPTNNEYGL